MTFLEQFLEYFSKHKKENDVIIFPNNRPVFEFKNLLQINSAKNSWLPEITSLGELLNNEFPYITAEYLDKILALNEAFRTTLSSDFGELNNIDFISKLIEDFDEVGREKIDPNDIFSKVSYIKLLEKWEIDSNSLGELGKNNLKFWENLPAIFLKYQELLAFDNFQSQPQILTKINNNNSFIDYKKSKAKFWLVGFNNFNASELDFIAGLDRENEVECVFDIDDYYFKNELDVAGKFLKKTTAKIQGKKTFLNPEWQGRKQGFSHNESGGNETMISAIFSKVSQLDIDQKTAVVFLDQSLMQTAIFSLPNSLNHVNIGAGIQVQFTFGFSLVLNYLEGRKKEFIDSLKQLPISNFKKTLLEVENNQYPKSVWVVFDNLKIILKELEFSRSNYPKYTFILSVISACTNSVDSYLKKKEKFQKLPDDFILKSFISELRAKTIDTLSEKQSKIQFLGLLETRNIDFDNVLMISFNDNVLPGNLVSNSIIPFDVRNRYGLQMPNDSEGILTYYFYQCIQRAKSVDLFSIQSSLGFNTSEPTRYLNQLKNSFPGFASKLSEKKIEISKRVEVVNDLIIPQSRDIKNKIRHYLTNRGCSVSALNLLIRNPIDFYIQYVLGLKEPEPNIDDVSHAELGTLFHNVLEDLYIPYISKALSEKSMEEMNSNVPSVLESNISKLKERLNPSVAVMNLYKNICEVWVYKFLKYDASRVDDGSIVILKNVEEKCEVELPIKIDGEIIKIKLVGTIDRVEKENGVLRLVDYKTGKVEQKNLKIDSLEKVFIDPDQSKSNQLLFYSYIYGKGKGLENIESGIYSCRNSTAGIIPLLLQKESRFEEDKLYEYQQLLISKIESVFEEDFNFEESDDVYSRFFDLMV